MKAFTDLCAGMNMKDEQNRHDFYLLIRDEVKKYQASCRNLFVVKDSWRRGMAAHSSIPAWRIPWRGAWRATDHRAAQSWTQLKRLGTAQDFITRLYPPDLSIHLTVSSLNFNLEIVEAPHCPRNQVLNIQYLLLHFKVQFHLDLCDRLHFMTNLSSHFSRSLVGFVG